MKEKKRISSLLRMKESRQFQLAEFPVLNRRPINYFRDVIIGETDKQERKGSEVETSLGLKEALLEEKAKWKKEAEQENRRSFQKGLAEGREEGAREFRRGLDLLTQYAALLQAEQKEVAVRLEREGIKIGFAVARKILTQELETKPEVIRSLAAEAVRQVLDCDQIRLRVNPEDLQYLNSLEEAMAGLLARNASIEMRGDPGIQRGDCLIETERGILDARISSQLEALHSGMSGTHDMQEI